MDYDIRLTESQVVDLLLDRKIVKIDIDGLKGKYSLEGISALSVRKQVNGREDMINIFTLFCKAFRGATEHRVRLELVVEEYGSYKGKLVFSSKHV